MALPLLFGISGISSSRYENYSPDGFQLFLLTSINYDNQYIIFNSCCNYRQCILQNPFWDKKESGRRSCNHLAVKTQEIHAIMCHKKNSFEDKAQRKIMLVPVEKAPAHQNLGQGNEGWQMKRHLVGKRKKERKLQHIQHSCFFTWLP